MHKYLRVLPACLAGLATACSFDAPKPQDAINYLTQRAGYMGWQDVKVSDCSGPKTLTTCVISYNRTTGGYRFYEELKMEFTKTPSGWTPQGYQVLKTQPL
ncbi:hypothetical protein [Nitratireductor sp. StC3]|uniref:hypothetical protein n=1 Tax=Nitratireductor sp. StC3 TaxID=2126741 RepID=UPI000D0DFFEE|nr:hypothetical protein [Nitratireductor sp. StC3]PSM19843.1 hypothetical protein C7T96_01870 [Nitratireductor sp. StC3]